MQQAFFEAVQKEEVKMAGMPSFEPTVDEEGKDLEFKATFEVYPEITLGDFFAIEVEQKTSEVKEEDINTMLETLQKQNANWEKSEEAAVDGDRVIIEIGRAHV